MSRHMKWINLACKMSRHSENEHQIGAVVVKSGKNILSTGFNKVRNDINVCDKIQDAHIHAEIDALKGVDDPTGSTVYVGRENSSGEKLTSAPCWRCARTLQEAGVSKVVYIGQDGNLEIVDFKKNHVPDFREAYIKANASFNDPATFPFREIYYSWMMKLTPII